MCNKLPNSRSVIDAILRLKWFTTQVNFALLYPFLENVVISVHRRLLNDLIIIKINCIMGDYWLHTSKKQRSIIYEPFFSTSEASIDEAFLFIIIVLSAKILWYHTTFFKLATGFKNNFFSRSLSFYCSYQT